MTYDRAERWAWVVGAAGLLVALAGWLVDPSAFAYAWLSALAVWIGWPLGCMGLLLIHALTGGRWGDAIRPYLLAGIAMLPMVLIALVPLLFVAPHLYPWMHPDVGPHLANGFYLNRPFAIGRLIFYLVCWFAIGALVLRAAGAGTALTGIAPPGLILLGLTVTFTAIDATASLDPSFSSSAYGMVIAAAYGLLALAICILVAALLSPLPHPALGDLGQLLLALLILWAYLEFVQFLIVWQSDLPHESHWYIVRSGGAWGIVAALVAVGHFLLPFIALVARRLRSSRGGIIGITTVLIAMELLRSWWLVLPADGRFIGWIDIAAMLAFGGFGAAIMLRDLGPRIAAMASHHA
jgi:hypothetical protein